MKNVTQSFSGSTEVHGTKLRTGTELIRGRSNLVGDYYGTRIFEKPINRLNHLISINRIKIQLLRVDGGIKYFYQSKSAGLF